MYTLLYIYRRGVGGGAPRGGVWRGCVRGGVGGGAPRGGVWRGCVRGGVGGGPPRGGGAGGAPPRGGVWRSAGIFAAGTEAGTQRGSSVRRSISLENRSFGVEFEDVIALIINYLDVPFGMSFTGRYIS